MRRIEGLWGRLRADGGRGRADGERRRGLQWVISVYNGVLTPCIGTDIDLYAGVCHIGCCLCYDSQFSLVFPALLVAERLPRISGDPHLVVYFSVLGDVTPTTFEEANE